MSTNMNVNEELITRNTLTGKLPNSKSLQNSRTLQQRGKHASDINHSATNQLHTNNVSTSRSSLAMGN